MRSDDVPGTALADHGCRNRNAGFLPGGFMTRSVANVIAGRWVKYAFIVFWIAVVAVASPLSRKLTDVEKNDSKTWLPGKAESVQVIDIEATFRSPNTIPAVVVYERTSGLTAADLAKMRADAQEFGGTAELDGRVIGPV